MNTTKIKEYNYNFEGSQVRATLRVSLDGETTLMLGDECWGNVKHLKGRDEILEYTEIFEDAKRIILANDELEQ